MEVIFSELKQKEVISIADGRHLGKVCDLSFVFPEGKVTGLTVTGCKGFKFTKQEIFLPLKCVVRIGEDAVLVNFSENPPPPPPNGKDRQYCPSGFQPPAPPPPPFCPPPPAPPQQSRRSLDEYE